MHNPYYEQVKEFLPAGSNRHFLLEGGLSRSMEGFEKREKLVGEYSWAIPNEEAIQALVDASPIVEIGAGTGYWAHLVRSQGGIIHPYDNGGWHRYSNKLRKANANKLLHDTGMSFPRYLKSSQWCTVKRGGPEKVKNHPDCTLFLCWPPYMDSMAVNSLKDYKGDTLIYVGEQHGCTGSPYFQTLLDTQWGVQKIIAIPKYDGIHDAMYIYGRN